MELFHLFVTSGNVFSIVDIKLQCLKYTYISPTNCLLVYMASSLFFFLNKILDLNFVNRKIISVGRARVSLPSLTISIKNQYNLWISNILDLTIFFTSK